MLVDLHDLEYFFILFDQVDWGDLLALWALLTLIGVDKSEVDTGLAEGVAALSKD